MGRSTDCVIEWYCDRKVQTRDKETVYQVNIKQGQMERGGTGTETLKEKRGKR